MISKFIIALRKRETGHDATGTFADGAFPLTIQDQAAFQRGSNLRNSYGRDYNAGRNMEKVPAVFA
ncbi:hypothetical protein E2F50_01415 [Rhizobium deserti]|uniref:Uncharacterized protein n=1 Tax=Rhizobium deserti TaxID=2547961 RepID=A0A4R5ULV7_9HYPH|nr:hypothetical protein [Rhizobium deserti]TDK38832.1 hypothetical protein E2F50_01415 [Rhizobium deserti]